MALDVDLLLDRRRLKRRLIIWRTVAVIACVLAVLAGLRRAGFSDGQTHVARLSVNGLITEDRRLLDAIRHAGRDSNVKALIVSINSPGGTVSGGEALYRVIGGVAEKKPVVAVMRGLAASAGYMIAMPASRIFARESTVTGSIGVILQTAEISGLMEKVGVSSDVIASGPLKDQPNVTRPLSPEGREALKSIVLDMYDQFIAMVATGRHMDPAAVRALADGRAYTGRQALKLGLIDAIGDEQDARNWLETAKGIPATTPVDDISTSDWAGRMLAGELSFTLDSLWKSLISQSVMLDLPMAIWHH